MRGWDRQQWIMFWADNFTDSDYVGFIDTDTTRELPQEQRDALSSQIPLGRLGAAEEVAAAVVFLASPSAAYITGETIHVNGGMFMP